MLLLSNAHASLCTDVPSMIVQKIEWVHFHPVGSQCIKSNLIKIPLITNWKKTFLGLKTLHVEPIWFSLDNWTLCGRSYYSQMVLHAIKENFRCAEAFLLRTGRLILLFSSKIETSSQQNKQSSNKLEIPCGTRFFGF